MGAIELGWISAVAASIDFLIAVYILKISGIPPMVCVLSSSVLILLMFSFRTLEAEYMKDLRRSIPRNAVSSILADILFHILIGTDLTVILLFSSITISLVNFTVLHTSLLMIPRRVFVVDPKDFRDLHGILKEIEDKSMGKIVFKPANPHISEYPSYTVVVTSQEQPSDIGKVKIYDLAEKFLKRIPLEILDRFESEYGPVFSNIKEPPYKRILDFFVSIVGLIIFSPIMAAIAILIILEDGFPVIFRQERVGKDGNVFVMYKFRSMKNSGNSSGRFATEEDHRILKIGKFIRKFRFDEILQFINVLKGDMSVIGPRPEQRELSEEFEKIIPHYRYRYSIRPGITGWAQLMYKYTSNIEETKIKLSYDLYYIKNMGLLLDLEIILKTLEVMLFRRGAR